MATAQVGIRKNPRRKAAGGFHPQPRSAAYGQKLRCTRNMPETTDSSSGWYRPAGLAPPPPKFIRMVAGFMFCWIFDHITSTPMSRFFTGFHTVREPTPQTSNEKSQPRTPPVAKLGAPDENVR